MAELYRLTDGTTYVDLNLSTGIYGTRYPAFSMGEGNYERHPGLMRFVEDYSLIVKGSSQDNAATQIRALRSLLRKAYLFGSSYQSTPVYLIQQASAETNARYALVYGSPDVDIPNPLSYLFEQRFAIYNLTIKIERGIWRSGAPGTLPTAYTLTASDGPASQTEVQVVNFRDDVAVTHIYNYDSSLTAFSANQVSATGITLFAVSGSTPAINDGIYIGSTTAPWRSINLVLATAGAMNVTWAIQYLNGGGSPAYTSLTANTQYSVYPTAPATAIFNSTGLWSVNVQPPSDWAVATINGVSAYWIFIKLTAVTTWTTTPVSHATYAPWTQKTNHVELASTILKGDLPPVLLARMWAPGAGATTAPGLAGLSRILVGAKSDGLSYFVSHLNLGNAGNPGAWTTSYGTDSSSSADVTAPRGLTCAVTFSTDTTQAVRVTLTGDDVADDWRGTYRVFVAAQQIGGANGDTRVRAVAMLGAVTSGYPVKYIPSASVALGSHDLGYEWVDLGYLRIPFTDTIAGDTLSQDLILQVIAERVVGSATIKLAELVLLPIHEWACQIDDPITSTTTGASALKENSVLDVDGGVLLQRTQKYQNASGTLYPAEVWLRDGENMRLEPGRQTRLYFMVGHYATTFGSGPLMATPAAWLNVSLYGHAVYESVRGSD